MKSSVEQIPLNSFLCRHEAHNRYSCCQIKRLETACKKFLNCLMVIEQTWMHKQVCIMLHIQKTKKIKSWGAEFWNWNDCFFFLTNRETQSDLYCEKSQSSEAGVGLSLCWLLQKLTVLIRPCDGIHDKEVTSKGAKQQSIKGQGSATC